MRGIYPLVEKLLISHDGLFFMELVT